LFVALPSLFYYELGLGPFAPVQPRLHGVPVMLLATEVSRRASRTLIVAGIREPARRVQLDASGSTLP
jgi:hypothetical protein